MLSISKRHPKILIVISSTLSKTASIGMKGIGNRIGKGKGEAAETVVVLLVD